LLAVVLLWGAVPIYSVRSLSARNARLIQTTPNLFVGTFYSMRPSMSNSPVLHSPHICEALLAGWVGIHMMCLCMSVCRHSVEGSSLGRCSLAHPVFVHTLVAFAWVIYAVIAPILDHAGVRVFDHCLLVSYHSYASSCVRSCLTSSRNRLTSAIAKSLACMICLICALFIIGFSVFSFIFIAPCSVSFRGYLYLYSSL